MKNILLLLLLFYCNSFELIGLNSNSKNFFNSSSFSFFNIISKTTAQSINLRHQDLICEKLNAADFNNDGIINGADYSMLYLVSMKDQSTIELLQKNPDLYSLMDLSLDIMNRKLASKSNDQEKYQGIINEQDVAIFYNYLTNKIPYCPYTNP